MDAKAQTGFRLAFYLGYDNRAAAAPSTLINFRASDRNAVDCLCAKEAKMKRNSLIKWVSVPLALIAVQTLSISASDATTINYVASLSGPAESPPTASPGIGFATVVADTTAHTLSVNVSFIGLLGTTTASHIHCCTSVPLSGNAGVATTTPSFLGFPLGVTSGTYSNTLDLTLASSFNPAFVAANGGTFASAEAVLFAGLAAGTTYFNIHTTAFPGGEIRGFLQAPVPGPIVGAGLPGLVMAFGGLLAWRRRKATPVT